METGAELDRINEEFYTGQDLRRYRARGAEERLLKETKENRKEQQERLKSAQERLNYKPEDSRNREQLLVKKKTDC